MLHLSFTRLQAIALPFILLLTLMTFSCLGADNKAMTLSETLAARLDQIEATINRDGLEDNTFKDLQAQLLIIQNEATEQKKVVQPELQEAQARLDALKPAETKEGEENNPEASLLIERRKELEAQVAQLDGNFKLLTSSIVRAKQLSNKITLVRQERFTRQLFDRSGTIVNPELWLRGLSGLATTWQATVNLFSDWGSFLSSRAADHAWQIAAMIAFVALLIAGPLRHLLFSGLSRLARLESPTPLQRSLHACWALFVYTVVPVSILYAIILILSNAYLLPTRIQMLADEVAFVVFSASLSYGLVRILLSPLKPNYRLLNIQTGDARKLYGIALALLVIFSLETLFDKTSEILLTPLETTISISGISALLTALLIWAGMHLMVSAKPLREAPPTRDSRAQQNGFSLPGFLGLAQPLVWLACLFIAAAPILGYVSLGAFLAEQLARTFIILALLGILIALIDNFLLENQDVSDGWLPHISRAMGIPSRAINQFSVLLNGFLRILLYVAAALLIFAPWGVESTSLLTSLQNAIFNIQIGDLSISPINILGALLVFIVTLVLVKSIQRWMENRFMPSTNLDTGLKNSIQTSVGYVGFVLSAMLAFSYMGVNLSNIALVAGALSVGIGFGLQSIVNNFVSGLILLVERPIKTGDWVVVGSDQGYVKKISVRATKIETFDRATVIVPNSDLISNRVMNWMHNGSMGRIIIPIGVSYDSDPEQVREILLKVAQDSEHIVSFPIPNVYFMDFGASSLDFELRCYVNDINNSLSVKSALRFALFKALKDANIEIPFPQQDVYVRSVSLPERPGTTTTRNSSDIRGGDTSGRGLETDEIDLEDLQGHESSEQVEENANHDEE